MLAILLTLLLAAAPFWEAKGPTAWSEDELNQLLTESPWAQVAEGAGANLPGVQVYLATAKPIQLAEAERERRAKVIHAEGEFQAAEKLAQAARDTEDLQRELSRLDAVWNERLANIGGNEAATEQEGEGGSVANVVSLANRIKALQKDVAG